MGELIEAQRIVWGTYRRSGEKWQVAAHVLNVADGKASAELSAASADWFEVRDQLTEQVLKELNVAPSVEECRKMTRRWTTSLVALEWLSKSIALDSEDKPYSEQEECERKAIEADPQCAEAYVALAASLDDQGKSAQAEEAIRQALKIRPDYAKAHEVLGIFRYAQDKSAEAERAFREAHRLDPEATEPLFRLGIIYMEQGKWDETIAFLNQAKSLDPTDSSVHSFLGLAYASKRDRTRLMAELKEAERFNTEDVRDEAMMALAYEIAGEIPLAVEHYEKAVTLRRKQGGDPEGFRNTEERLRELKARLTPTLLDASMPRVYTHRTLQDALRERLTKDELKLVDNPLASSRQMRRWVQQLTRDTKTDMDKARKLFDGLVGRAPLETVYTARTAREVFAAWGQPDEMFSCQEFAKLFTVLAREVGLKAFYVYVKKDYRGQEVNHACACVFVDDKLLLADPTYRWFGVPHKEFVILDDLQTIAHHLSQYRDIPRCRVAAGIEPHAALVQFNLVVALVNANLWEEVRPVVKVILQIEPERWIAQCAQGFLALHDEKIEQAVNHFRKAVEIIPDAFHVRFYLAVALLAQGKLKEAREEFRVCLQNQPPSDVAEQARRAIAQINEQIGVESL